MSTSFGSNLLTTLHFHRPKPNELVGMLKPSPKDFKLLEKWHDPIKKRRYLHFATVTQQLPRSPYIASLCLVSTELLLFSYFWISEIQHGRALVFNWLYAPKDLPLTNHNTSFSIATATVGQGDKNKPQVNPYDKFYIKNIYNTNNTDNNKTTHTKRWVRYC